MKIIISIMLAFFYPATSFAQPTPFHIYINGDFSNSKAALSSIKLGVEVAFSEIDNEIKGHPIKIKLLDHRGNVSRTKLNYQKIVNDPKTLAVFTGIHSRTIIPNRSYINENEILTLIPWAAGGPVTRARTDKNWIYRLSLDDSKTAAVIIDYALNIKNCKNPHLFLEKSPWGDANLNSMTKVLTDNYGISSRVTRANLQISVPDAKIIIREIKKQGSDCIIEVASNGLAKKFTTAMDSFPVENQLPIVSHWGITASDFWKKIPEGSISATNIRFIQSCYSFNSDTPPSPFRASVFEKLSSHSADIQKPDDLKAQVGFIHAYDLSKVFIQAMHEVIMSDDITANKTAIKMALENLQKPVQGLIKTYQKPFSQYDPVNNRDAHEALNPNDFCMARYAKNGSIVLVE